MFGAYKVPAEPNFTEISPNFFTRSSGSVSWTSWCHMTGLQLQRDHRSTSTRKDCIVMFDETTCLEFLDLWSKRPEPFCCQGNNVYTVHIRKGKK